MKDQKIVLNSERCLMLMFFSYVEIFALLMKHLLIGRSIHQSSWSDGRQLVVPKGTSRHTIRELLPYTRYQVRVSARNIVGRGPPSEPTDYTYTKSESKGIFNVDS